MSSFATVQELEAFWRSLTGDEQSRAGDLLNYASDYLRLLGENIGLDIDAKSADNSVYESNLKFITMSATQRAMSAPEMSGGAESYTQTAGPYSENYKFANPNGDLYFTKRELSILGLKGQSITTISSTRRDIY